MWARVALAGLLAVLASLPTLGSIGNYVAFWRQDQSASWYFTQSPADIGNFHKAGSEVLLLSYHQESAAHLPPLSLKQKTVVDTYHNHRDYNIGWAIGFYTSNGCYRAFFAHLHWISESSGLTCVFSCSFGKSIVAPGRILIRYDASMSSCMSIYRIPYTMRYCIAGIVNHKSAFNIADSGIPFKRRIDFPIYDFNPGALSFNKMLSSQFIGLNCSCCRVGGGPGCVTRISQSEEQRDGSDYGNQGAYYRNPDLYPRGHSYPEGRYGHVLLGLKIATLIACGVASAGVGVGLTFLCWRRSRCASLALLGLGAIGCATFYGWAAFGAPWEFWRLPFAWGRYWLGLGQ